MRALRFGSYSIAATFAGIPLLSRLKSISRYDCLCPPPINREETRPVEDRPPVFGLPLTRLFSGFCLVISSRETTVWKRRVGVVGLKLFTGMLDLRVLRHLLAGLQNNPGFLPVRAIARKLSAPPQLARRHRCPNLGHLHFESRFHRVPDLGLVSINSHLKAQRAMIVLLRDPFFGHKRTLDYVV